MKFEVTDGVKKHIIIAPSILDAKNWWLKQYLISYREIQVKEVKDEIR